jgi:Insect cuticle protein
LGTENGIEIEQLGKLKPDNKTLVVTGSYSYTGANGKRYRVRYTADEFGYHPKTELIIDLPE